MALQNKLKAFVRFDGSGRVIPSSLILQKSKPKVGNWKEINATQCCNSTPITTSTTTTNGNTAHAFYLPFWTDLNSACNYPPNNSLIFYSASAVLQQGSFLFYDAALTSPAIGVYLNLPGSIRLQSVSGGYLQNYTCGAPTQHYMYAAYSPYNACQGTAGSGVYLYTAGSNITVGTTFYIDSQLTAPYNSYQYGSSLALNGSVYFVGDTGGSSVVNVSSCSGFITTTTTTTQALFPVEVYVQGGSTNSNLCPEGSTGSGTEYIYCTTPTLQAGSKLYQNGQIIGAGGFWYKQVGYNTVWSPMYNDGVLYQGCLNSGTLTGKITNDSSTPCNGNGIDISFTIPTGAALGLTNSGIIAADGFSFFGAGFIADQNVRILQTGTNIWFNYRVLSDAVAVPQDTGAYTPYSC